MATTSATKAGSVRSPAPGLDIFRTPENATFYSANLYQTLDKSNQEIRLIELSTQTGSDGILECKLLPAVLLADTRKQYLALSYCAGDPTDKKEIKVNGVPCNVFENLHHALVLARRYWIQSPEQGPLRLWIDQLCINQQDLSERSHQVGFMREIYQSAERTLACLSSREASGEGLKWLNGLCDAMSFEEDYRPFQSSSEYGFANEGSDGSEEIPFEKDGLFETESDRLSSYRLEWTFVRDYLWDNIHNVRFVNGWIEFYDVLRSQWWNRAWICQEFLVSSYVTFMFGNYFVSWGQCWRVILGFCGIHKHDLMKRERFLEFTKHTRGCLGDIQLCRILNNVNKKDLGQIEHVRTALEMKLRWRGGLDIKALLSHSRSCRSSDDRDRVYAMLGLASQGYQIFPDYSRDMTAAKVMIITTKAIIDKEDSLNILMKAATLVQFRDPNFPSWVVDWTSTEALDVEGNSFNLFRGLSWVSHESPQHAFETITSEFEQTQIHILRIYGTFITKIESKRTAKWPLANFWGCRCWEGSALVSIADGDEVWTLHGLRVPMVLRPFLNGYKVISCAFFDEQSSSPFNTVVFPEQIRARLILY
ncbi:hypothetical protein FPRO04_08116 [Fusarium proliferatum]|nr:hypothetical protein FPRO04_08116 [Fusarium proliferatum]